MFHIPYFNEYFDQEGDSADSGGGGVLAGGVIGGPGATSPLPDRNTKFSNSFKIVLQISYFLGGMMK